MEIFKGMHMNSSTAFAFAGLFLFMFYGIHSRAQREADSWLTAGENPSGAQFRSKLPMLLCLTLILIYILIGLIRGALWLPSRVGAGFTLHRGAAAFLLSAILCALGYLTLGVLGPTASDDRKRTFRILLYVFAILGWAFALAAIATSLMEKFQNLPPQWPSPPMPRSQHQPLPKFCLFFPMPSYVFSFCALCVLCG